MNISAITTGFPTSSLGSTIKPDFGAGEPTSPQGFGDLLKNITQSAVAALQSGEQTAIAAIEGKASIQSAVMATMEAEQSLQAALAIRDKIVGAFLEISRMQI